MHHVPSRPDVLEQQAPGAHRRIRTLLSLALLLLAWVSPMVPRSGIAAQEPTAAEVAGQVSDSVVTVYTWTEGGTFSPGRTGREPTGAGSGWVYAADGIVVTNNHVVDGVDEVKVVTAGGTVIPAEVVGTDWYRDVAVLRLEPQDDQDLPPAATVGDSDAVRPGDEVVAIGTPLGQFANTVSVGHVDATHRSLNTGVGYSLNHLIQHDAAILPGNSGGPLVSMDGEVIGMNVASAQSTAAGRADAVDISFAIESNTVVAAVGEILASGTVAYPYLGIQTRVTADGTTLATRVEPGSPAAAAGFRPGDVLVAVDGEPVGDGRGFIDLLYSHRQGETITVTIERDGREIEVDVKLGARPAAL